MRWFFLTLFLVVLVASLVIATPSWSGDLPANCASRDGLTKQMINEDRAPILAASTADGKVLEIWSLPGYDDWILVVTTKDGVSCVVNKGSKVHIQEYQGINPKTNI